MTKNKRVEAKLEDVAISLMAEYEGEIYLVTMDKEKYDAIQFLIKRSMHSLLPTNKKGDDFFNYLGVYEK